MATRWKILAGIGTVGLVALLWIGQSVWDYFDPSSIAHLAMQYHLKLMGSAMYEYHANTGRWPTGLDDLGQTSLPVTSSVWRESAATMTFLWPRNLKADAKDNANVVLVYTDKGLYNNLGRMWVCWGDLRTEHMRAEDLRAQLARQLKPRP